MTAEDDVFPGKGDGLKYNAAGLGLEHCPANPSVAAHYKPQNLRSDMRNRRRRLLRKQSASTET